MSTTALEQELDRIAAAVARMEHAAALRVAQGAELTALKARHWRLKETVSSELQQLDLLLANLPQQP